MENKHVLISLLFREQYMKNIAEQESLGKVNLLASTVKVL